MGTCILVPTTAGVPGVTVATPASAWGFSSWVPVTMQSEQWAICGVRTMMHVIPTADSTFEMLVEVGTGAAGSEVTQVQIPFSCRSDTAVAYYFPPLPFLPEPYLIAAGTRVAVRFADASASAQTYSGTRLIVDRITPDGPRDFGIQLNQAVNRASTY